MSSFTYEFLVNIPSPRESMECVTDSNDGLQGVRQSRWTWKASTNIRESGLGLLNCVLFKEHVSFVNSFFLLAAACDFKVSCLDAPTARGPSPSADVVQVLAYRSLRDLVF